MGRFEGNATRFVYTPIANDATRTAALLSGDIDFTHEAPPQDVARLSQEPGIRLATGLENRIIYLGFGQYGDELLYSSVKGRNPFKDIRVREAFYLAIDPDALKTGTMRGQSVPTGCLTPAAVGCLAPELEARSPPDPTRAGKLLARAGYAQVFDITLDCPNDRYVNDQALCIAIAGMLGRVGVKVRVDARPKAIYFKKVDLYDTSFFLLGWGGSTTDAQGILDPTVHSFDATTQKGSNNQARIHDTELDSLIDAAAVDMNTSRRSGLIAEALRRTQRGFYYLPLHRQMLTWVSRTQVRPLLMPDNAVRVQWIQID